MHSSLQFSSALARAERQPSLALVATWMASLVLGFVLTGCGSAPSAALPSQKASQANGSGLAKNATSSSETGSSNTVAVASTSVFRTDLHAGGDPFFPKSKRRAAKTPDAVVAAPLPLLSYLKLVGIRPGTTRPMALINRTAFAPGEEGDVSIVVSNQLSQLQLQKISIRCLEIRRDSVLINIAGETGPKELRMAQGK